MRNNISLGSHNLGLFSLSFLKLQIESDQIKYDFNNGWQTAT